MPAHINPSDNHPRIRTLHTWGGRDHGGIFYERQSFWCCGANWHFWSWALPFCLEISRVWGSGKDGKAPWGLSRIVLILRFMCVSFHLALWNREGF